MLGTVLLTACSTLAWYGNAVSGQLHLLTERQAIDSLLDDPDTSPLLRNQLLSVQAIRRFAAEELQLPLRSQYSTYVDLQRPFVVWNVFASPALSMQPLTWCYPVAGCVTYRGYFNEPDAVAFAQDLQARGFDVAIGGVAAYSTLGWFSDPVLSTVIDRPVHQLAGLLFHELAHQVVYVPGATEFNESFATAVEREGLRRWLAAGAAVNGRDDANAALPGLIEQELMRQTQFVALVQTAAADLQTLYASDLGNVIKRSGKQQRLEQLRRDYQVLSQRWHGYDGYDAWFAGELNNAKLGTVVTYNSLLPAFATLLEQSNGSLPQFYQNVSALAKLPTAERAARLQALMPQTDPDPESACTSPP